jgi:hypothetical protein
VGKYGVIAKKNFQAREIRTRSIHPYLSRVNGVFVKALLIEVVEAQCNGLVCLFYIFEE